MKFLVINRPTGDDHGLGHDAGVAHDFAEQIEAAVANGTIECAYAFVSGGGAYVCTAKDTEELVKKVRLNPLFKSSHTEVIPIADAHDFLRGVAEFLS